MLLADLSLSSCRLWSRRHDFLLCQRERVKEGLHRGLAEAPATLVRAPLVVVDEPGVEVALQLVARAVDLLTEGNPVELVEDGAMEALANAIGLRALGLVRVWSMSSTAR